MTRRPAVLISLVATVLALLVTEPVIFHLGDYMYGIPGDAVGGVTLYWWWGYAITHGMSILDLRLQGVPLGSESAAIPYVVLPLLIIPFLSALIGPVASYNLMILSSFPLTALATYMLARRLRLGALGAAFSGLAFAFSPYHVEKAQGHGYQAHMELIAWTLYFLVGWRETGRRRDICLAGMMLGLQLWLDYSLTLVLGVALAAFFVTNVVLRPGALPWLRAMRENALAAGLMILVTLPFAPFMLLGASRPGSGAYTSSLSRSLATVHRNLDDLMEYSARLHEYVLPWHNNPLVPATIKTWEELNLHGSNWTESSLFVGYTVLALAAVGLAIGRRRFATLCALLLIAFGLIMAEPPIAHPFGVTVKAPSYYVHDLIAFFRVYARFAILVLLGTSLLAGLGVTAIAARTAPRWRPIALVLPLALLAVEFNDLPPARVTRIFPAPAEYTWLRDQPPGILLEYPAHSGPPPTLEVDVREYELYQMVHLHPTFLNESPLTGKVASAAQDLEPYYKPAVAAQLKAYGIRYVFVHRGAYARAGWQLPNSVAGLSYVTRIDDVDIYTVD